jgi:hypothetical protein
VRFGFLGSTPVPGVGFGVAAKPTFCVCLKQKLAKPGRFRRRPRRVFPGPKTRELFFVAGGVDDFGEAMGFQAGTANERTVNVGL